MKPELDLFVERYLPLFGRAENHVHAVEFVQGLLVAAERRNMENLAEAVAGGVVRTMQKFVSQGGWKEAELLTELRTHAAEVLGTVGATINVDETGFPKKGAKSVGVKRQYSGTLGRVDNCQVGVMANSTGTRSSTGGCFCRGRAIVAILDELSEHATCGWLRTSPDYDPSDSENPVSSRVARSGVALIPMAVDGRGGHRLERRIAAARYTRWPHVSRAT